jgi:hypothetical protein
MTETAQDLVAAVRADWADYGINLILADALDDPEPSAAADPARR